MGFVNVQTAPVTMNPSRTTFVRKTYAHLLVAVLGLVAFEAYIFTSGLIGPILNAIVGLPWFAILGAFMLVSWLARSVAARSTSKPAQYAALAGYVVAQGLILAPLIAMAVMQTGDGSLLKNAAFATAFGFAGLTAIVFTTKKDFSFLGGVLKWAGFCALGMIAGSLIFGFTLGTFFSAAMVLVAGAAILYDTSNVLLHYPEDRYVGASLELFASIAMLFWYILRLFMGGSRD